MKFTVLSRTTGGRYLTTRTVRTNGLKYRWIKDRSRAVHLTESAARSAAQRYNGKAIAING